MYFIIENNKLVRSQTLPENVPAVILTTYIPERTPANDFNIASSVFDETFTRNSFRYESCEGFDLLCLRLVNIEHFSKTVAPVYIFFKKNRLIIYAVKTDEAEARLERISKRDCNVVSLGEVMYHLLTDQISGDLKHLEGYESGFTALEEEIFSDGDKGGYTKKFIAIRKNLRRIKLYYEQFLNILGDVEANENELYDRHSLKQFKILTSKIERLYSKVMSLMDYVSEIRSAYQAEVDLELNKTMKVLTVMSAIVLPLTLIAGWYGMNLNMPEFGWRYGYVFVIALGICVVAVTVYVFKRHKWF